MSSATSVVILFLITSGIRGHHEKVTETGWLWQFELILGAMTWQEAADRCSAAGMSLAPVAASPGGLAAARARLTGEGVVERSVWIDGRRSRRRCSCLWKQKILQRLKQQSTMNFSSPVSMVHFSSAQSELSLPEEAPLQSRNECLTVRSSTVLAENRAEDAVEFADCQQYQAGALCSAVQHPNQLHQQQHRQKSVEQTSATTTSAPDDADESAALTESSKLKSNPDEVWWLAALSGCVAASLCVIASLLAVIVAGAGSREHCCYK